MNKTGIYEGFGVRRTGQNWAQLLDMRVSLFKYYTEEKGLTIEELFDLRGFAYKEPKKRKDRMGARMEQTQQRMYKLMTISGYVLDEGPDCIGVKVADTNGNHSVTFKNEPLGVYNYKTGGLKLSGGGGIPLWDIEWEDARVRKNNIGLWVVHPDTQRLIVEKAISQRTENPDAERYAQITMLHPPKNSKPGRQGKKYEGFGKQRTLNEWATTLDVPVQTLWVHLERKGKTIEEFVKYRHIRYPR